MSRLVQLLVCLVLFGASASTSNLYAASSPLWGKIANPQHQTKSTKAAFFFAGPPNPGSLGLYTRTPTQFDAHLWRSQADIDVLFDLLQATNVNVIKLSWWGTGNEYKQWAPTWNDKKANVDTFQTANNRNMLVAPVLEVSPAFKFWEEFPANTTNLETRIKQVLADYGNQPNWLTLYDQNGNPKKVIWLIETIHVGPVDKVQFAQTFDQVAQRIFESTGTKIGFIIDPTPLPPFGSYAGPDPIELKKIESILAINPFNITSDGPLETNRISKAETILNTWKQSGIPLMAPVLPGFDDHIVRPPGTRYGDNPTWRSTVGTLGKQYQTAGITLDIWNGFTEGYSFMPTTEQGEANYNLARTLFGRDKGDLDNNEVVSMNDLRLLINYFRSNNVVLGDVNSDGKLTIFDYSTVISHLGKPTFP